MSQKAGIGIRWTVGDVSREGFESLQLSVWGAWKVFGEDAAFVICVNTIPIESAKSLTGNLPDAIQWYDANDRLPKSIAVYLDRYLAEGVGWKFAPYRLFPDNFELSLDNDCILWEMPHAISKWLNGSDYGTSVMAADIFPCFGQFESLCPPDPRNSGIRGLSPGFNIEEALLDVLDAHPVTLVSELDEQGLQVAALWRHSVSHIVTVEEVTICSPFPPHYDYLGRCGAHFVGLNVKTLPWEIEGRPAMDHIRDNWQRLKGIVRSRVLDV